MTTFIDVETEHFAASARSMYRDVADPVADSVFALTHALWSTGGMAGSDPGGQAWAAAYDDTAEAAVRAGIAVANGGYHLSALLAQTARNYESADAASTPHGRAGAALVLPDPTRVGTGAFPPPAGGGTSALPAGWGSIEGSIGRVWPNGHQDRLDAAATAWERAGRALLVPGWRAPAAADAFGSDHLPEAADIRTVCSALEWRVEAVADAYLDLATACRDLAHHIDSVHSAVEHELGSLAWQSAAIEGIGALASLLSFGAAQLPTQAAELARIAAIAGRIRVLIDTFTVAARVVAARVAVQLPRFEALVDELRGLSGMQLAVAGVSTASRLPGAVRVGELAEARIAAGSDRLQALLMEQRRTNAARGSGAAASRLDQARAQWANPDKLLEHFKDHGYQFGARTQEEYSELASAFFWRALRDKLPTKVDGKIIRFYDPTTDTFGSYLREGKIITFFKPGRRGETYWESQPGALKKW